MILYAIAFTIFAWLARIRHFLISLIAIIILVVVVRLVLNS
jgi:hypothetical protein